MHARKIRDINYQLAPGTCRSTTDIIIERNGTVVVRAPKNFNEAQVDAIVESKRMWIYRNLAEWRDLNSATVVRSWVNGESFLYLGRSYRLSLLSNQECDVKLYEGRFWLKRELIEIGGIGSAKKALENYYTVKGLQRFEERIKYFAPKVGVKPHALRISNMGYRWASCSKNNVLSLHWKCMMAPPKIIDYIIVHELCHIHHRNHTDAFWNEVDKVMPDYRERKTWLRFNGASLNL